MWSRFDLKMRWIILVLSVFHQLIYKPQSLGLFSVVLNVNQPQMNLINVTKWGTDNHWLEPNISLLIKIYCHLICKCGRELKWTILDSVNLIMQIMSHIKVRSTGKQLTPLIKFWSITFSDYPQAWRVLVQQLPFVPCHSETVKSIGTSC